MKEIVEVIERFPVGVQQWADIIALVGIVGGLVFAVWVVGGSILDLLTTVFRRIGHRPGKLPKPGRHRGRFGKWHV